MCVSLCLKNVFSSFRLLIGEFHLFSHFPDHTFQLQLGKLCFLLREFASFLLREFVCCWRFRGWCQVWYKCFLWFHDYFFFSLLFWLGAYTLKISTFKLLLTFLSSLYSFVHIWDQILCLHEMVGWCQLFFWFILTVGIIKYVCFTDI